MKRVDIVKEARTWLGTPFLHQGRLKGVGVDCAGVVEMTPRALGEYKGITIAPYLSYPNRKEMYRELSKHMISIAFADLMPGDVLWFRVDVEGQHLGLVTSISPLSMVHAFGREGIKKCVEQPIGVFWKQRLVGCWRYKGIQ